MGAYLKAVEAKAGVLITSGEGGPGGGDRGREKGTKGYLEGAFLKAEAKADVRIASGGGGSGVGVVVGPEVGWG